MTKESPPLTSTSKSSLPEITTTLFSLSITSDPLKAELGLVKNANHFTVCFEDR